VAVCSVVTKSQSRVRIGPGTSTNVEWTHWSQKWKRAATEW